MEQGKHKETIHREAEKLPQYDINRDSDDEWNSVILQETMDTDQCIQRLVRTEPEGSDCAQCKIEDTTQYWAMKEKEAATNYCRVLELNKWVSHKRVQQLYSQDQTQEVVDQAERQAASAGQTLDNIQRVLWQWCSHGEHQWLSYRQPIPIRLLENGTLSRRGGCKQCRILTHGLKAM